MPVLGLQGHDNHLRLIVAFFLSFLIYLCTEGATVVRPAKGGQTGTHLIIRTRCVGNWRARRHQSRGDGGSNSRTFGSTGINLHFIDGEIRVIHQVTGLYLCVHAGSKERAWM